MYSGTSKKLILIGWILYFLY